MPTIIPIRDLRKTSELSEIAHKSQEPIFVTKNGYGDLVVMSMELYETDQVLSEAEDEVAAGAKPISAKKARKALDRKHLLQKRFQNTE